MTDQEPTLSARMRELVAIRREIARERLFGPPPDETPPDPAADDDNTGDGAA